MDQTIPVLTRNVDQIETNKRLAITFERNTAGQGERDGFITDASENGMTGEPVFIRLETDKDTVEVEIGETVGDSFLRERRGGEEGWNELGDPLRVGVYDVEDRDEMRAKAYHEMMFREFESIVAVAQVKWNSKILGAWASHEIK